MRPRDFAGKGMLAVHFLCSLWARGAVVQVPGFPVRKARPFSERPRH